MKSSSVSKNMNATNRFPRAARIGLLSLAVAVIGLSIPVLVLAHGGEDHGDAVTSIQITSGRHSASAQSENFDLVAQYGVIEPGKPENIDLYLADYATNAPVANAEIKVGINGAENVNADAVAEKDPGLYSVKLTFPKEGHFELLFDITTGDKSDIIEVKGIQVGDDKTTPVIAKKSRLWIYLVSGFGILFLILVILFLRSRKHRKPITTATVAILLLLSVSNRIAQAHGGEDHGDAGGIQATVSTPGYLSKSSQFLLSVRTVLAKKQMVTKQLSALGRVVAPPTSQVQVYAPQSGVLVANPNGHYPNLGDWVDKGQTLAVLQVLNQFVVRAPISGVVSAVHAVPGEQVDPSHELFTIYNYKNVWVEANLFESDLIHLEAKPTASLSLDSYPGESFPTKFVNYDIVVDPATRTQKAIYEVSNPKMILRPGMVVNVNIESEKRLEALAVPSSSIMDWEGQKVVFVHEQPEIFEMRPVKILGYYGELVAVEGMIAEGDRVVTSGAYELLNIPHRLTEGRSK